MVEIYQDVFAANPFARVPAIPTLFAHDGRIYIQGGGVQPGGLSALDLRSGRETHPSLQRQR